MRKISILELGKWDSNSEWGREGLIEDQVLKEEERIRVMAKKENLGRKKKIGRSISQRVLSLQNLK